MTVELYEQFGIHYKCGRPVTHDRGANILRNVGQYATQRFHDDFDLSDELIDHNTIRSRCGIDDNHWQIATAVVEIVQT